MHTTISKTTKNKPRVIINDIKVVEIIIRKSRETKSNDITTNTINRRTKRNDDC
jgi:hypothetical protein